MAVGGMAILSILAGLAFAGSGVSLIITQFAPEGFEDETGFHYGSRHQNAVAPWATSSSPAHTQSV